MVWIKETAVRDMPLEMDELICVGFGVAAYSKGGEILWQEGLDTEDFPQGKDVEELALKDPDHDWRIIIHGPFYGGTWQRQGPGKWVLIEENDGFA